MRVIAEDEEVKVGYNTFYWVLYNSKKYDIGSDCEYVRLPVGLFWITTQCRINNILTTPIRTCEDSKKNPNWTVLPPGEYIIESTDSWVQIGDNTGTPSTLKVYVCELRNPDSWFQELFAINYEFKNNGKLYGYVKDEVVSERTNYRGGIQSQACTYPTVYKKYCKFDTFTVLALGCFSIACVKIKPVKIVELRYDGSFNIPLYAFVDGKLKWVNSNETVNAYKIVSAGPVFKINYDPFNPNAVRTDIWSCGKITLLNLPKPEKHTPTPKPQPKRNTPVQKKEIYDLNYYSGYLYFRSNYSGLAELVVGKSVRKIQVKKGINKVPLTVDKEIVVCVNPV